MGFSMILGMQSRKNWLKSKGSHRFGGIFSVGIFQLYFGNPSARQIGEKPQISRILLVVCCVFFRDATLCNTEVLHNRIEGANVAPKKMLRFFLFGSEMERETEPKV